ncbi:MAG: dihydropteroate synthase [Paracoccaceae bacterium]|nr:MAG: dihydropteroate synthase [Paracoccaceae bacterium]
MADPCYPRPIPCTDPVRPPDAQPLAGGWCWFDRVHLMQRGGPGTVVAARSLPSALLDRLTAPRAPLAGLSLDRPRIMGVLNITPDSFSDGGRFLGTGAALAQARALTDGGADILDIGGESTRPGAEPVPDGAEIARTAPVIAELRRAGLAAPISIDTRKLAVARAAVQAGAAILNDVSALTWDAALGPYAADAGLPVILMHAQGLPETMQDDPRYDDVLLDVFDALAARIEAAMAAGIPRNRLVVDPGIGFGKTVAHNLALIRGLSLFHALGLPVLLGASRKRFIGTIGGEPRVDRRMPGSLAVALAGLAQGAQIVRVHDVAETRQAVALWQAIHTPGERGERA